MGYDRGDSFIFDFEPNKISFGRKSKGKLSPRSYPIQCERKWKYSFVSVDRKITTNRLISCPREWRLSDMMPRDWRLSASWSPN